MLRPVEVEEGPRDGVAGDELRLLDQRLEQAAANDLEAFFRARRRATTIPRAR